MQPTPLAQNLTRVQFLASRTAAVGVLLMAVGFLFDREQFFRSYLFAYLAWLAPSLGSLAVVMLHNMTGGQWGFAIRRLLEAGIRTIPFQAALFLPLLLGISSLYEWSHEDVVAVDPLLQAKSAWLNETFFSLRAIVYFVAWIALARGMVRATERYDRTLDIGQLRRTKVLSGIGLVVYVLTMSFASFDWGMSLEPHWFSTIYGVHFVVSQALATLCLAIVVSSRLARHEPFSRWLSPSHFHDLGNLLLAFVMLWAYISFSQFMIVWSGNLPEETPWYLNRVGGGWQAISIFLIVFHFAIPFLVLLVRRNKRRIEILAKLALAVFLMRFVDLFWHVAPAFRHGHFGMSWQDVVAPVALGGIWITLFTRNLRGRPLVSLQDGKLLRELEEAAT